MPNKPFFDGYKPQFYFRTQPRIAYDELRNETHIPSEIQAEIDAADEVNEHLRQYARDTLEDGGSPTAAEFIAYNERPWRKYADGFEEYAEKVIAEEMAKWGV
jgi:hypothetical protein